MTCTARGRRVTCKVVVPGRANARTRAGARKVRASQARLVRRGRTYARGTVGSLRAVRKVDRGRYTLRIAAGGGKVQKVAVTVRDR